MSKPGTDKRRVRLRAVMIGVALVWSGCAGVSVPPPAAVAGENAPTILVIKSSDNALFDIPLAAFVAQLEGHANIYVDSLKGKGNISALADELKPDLLFVLGTKAALVARRDAPHVPTMFAMVVNHGRHAALKHEKVMGVALETPAYTEFAQFKMVVPSLQKILVFHVPEASGTFVERAKDELAGLGVELLAVPVEVGEDIPNEYQKHVRDADGVWLLNDPVVMNPKTFAYLRGVTLRDHVPFVSSLSEKFAHEGALMSVSVDFTSLGAQAAAMVQRVLQGDTPDKIGIQAPIGGKLVLNLDTAHKIGLTIPDDVLPFVNEVISTELSARAAPRRDEAAVE